MNLESIIEHLATVADDFLDGVTSREQARAGISEEITLRYLHLTYPDRMAVINGVMEVLENEDFFNAERGDASDDGDVQAGEE